MDYRCPVCFFDKMPYPANDYNICPCCGTEFGNDDVDYTLEELRESWIENDCPWFYEEPPEGWNPYLQLVNAGHPELVPSSFHNLSSDMNISWYRNGENSIRSSLWYENVNADQLVCVTD